MRHRTGVMLQEGGFPSELTVAETARMWAGCVSGARPEREVLALVGLASKTDVRVKQLSGGQRRRLDLALALLGDPEVLFLDEPTTGLDAEGRHDTWELVSALRDAGTTVLLTTHYLEEAENLADRLAIMHDGRIAVTGTPAEVTATEPSRITFDLPDGYHLGDLPPLGPMGVGDHTVDGRTVRLRTRDLQRSATALLVWARDAGVELRRLDVRSASLEEAFLTIAKDASAPRAARRDHRGVRGMSITTTTPAGRMMSLARAELTLLGRSKGTLFAALFVPLVLPLSVRSAAEEMDLAEAGLTPGELVLPAAVGFSLLFAVYSSLVGVYVVRREELVLKRLRTGELRDAEILAGSALPAVLTGLVQCLLLITGCTVLLDLSAPSAPHLAVLGLLLGLVISAALAAFTASWTRTGESAQVTPMPLLIVSMLGSGMFVPLELFPDRLASVCELLPLTPVVSLVRGGWTGDLTAGESLGALTIALAWTVLAVFAVRRRFRWEPRR